MIIENRESVQFGDQLVDSLNMMSVGSTGQFKLRETYNLPKNEITIPPQTRSHSSYTPKQGPLARHLTKTEKKAKVSEKIVNQGRSLSVMGKQQSPLYLAAQQIRPENTMQQFPLFDQTKDGTPRTQRRRFVSDMQASILSGTTSNQFIVQSECEIVFKDQNNVTIKEFDVASLTSHNIDGFHKLSKLHTEYDLDLFSEDHDTFNFEAVQAKRGRSQMTMKIFEPS